MLPVKFDFDWPSRFREDLCSCPRRILGHPKVMIYTNFVELHCLMLYAKFQSHRPSGSGDEDFNVFFYFYSHGGHLGHVTWTIYTDFGSPFPRMLIIKFGFDWPRGFSGVDV